MKTRLTALLWAVNLAAISASVLVYLFLAHHAYRALGSLLLSEFVLLAPMLIPVLLAFQLNHVASRVGPRQLLLAANLSAALCCALLFFVFGLDRWSVLIGAAVIGTLDAVQRVARIVAIKRYFSAHELRYTVPLTLTAQFIAGAIAGSLLAFFPGQITHQGVAVVSVALLCLAAACALALPKAAATDAPAKGTPTGVAHGLALLRNTPALRDSLLAFVLLGAFFQGFYNLSRVALPAHHLGLGQFHVGLLQVVASLSAIAGALSYWALSRHGLVPRLRWVYVVCSAAMLAACWVPGVAASFACYFVYFFCFELAFFRLQADIMLATPSAEMPFVATLQYALVYAGMVLFMGLGAPLIQHIGLTATAALSVLGFAGCSALRRLLARSGAHASLPTAIGP